MEKKTNEPKKKRQVKHPELKRPHENSPVIGDNGLMLDPGDNAKYLAKNLALMNLPDIDMKDVNQVQERIAWYFNFMIETDCKPTMSGLAMSLNMSRRYMWGVVNDTYQGGHNSRSSLSVDVTNIIKKAYRIMETMWEDYMQNGKINPVSGIFLGKNNFHYVDKVEHVVTPNVNQDNDYDVDIIKSKYLIEDTNDDSQETN